jgi:hypothetical protein
MKCRTKTGKVYSQFVLILFHRVSYPCTVIVLLFLTILLSLTLNAVGEINDQISIIPVASVLAAPHRRYPGLEACSVASLSWGCQCRRHPGKYTQ